MVEVNLTLLIQIVHFVIAYMLLRVFLWRPVIKHLQNEERHKALLDDELKKQRAIVEQKEFDLTKVKNEARTAFAQNVPVVGRFMSSRVAFAQDLKAAGLVLSPETTKNVVAVIVQKVQE